MSHCLVVMRDRGGGEKSTKVRQGKVAAHRMDTLKCDAIVTSVSKAELARGLSGNPCLNGIHEHLNKDHSNKNWNWKKQAILFIFLKAGSPLLSRVIHHMLQN